MAEKQYLDTAAASKWFHDVGVELAEQTLKNKRAHNQGPRFVKIGGKVRYRIADLERYLEKNTVDPKAA